MKISILHLINSLETGGAETQLLHLLNEVDQQNFEWHLGYLHKSGELLNNYYNPKIRIIDLSGRGKFSLIKIAGLYRYIKKHQITVIHTYLIQAGIVGFFLGKLAGVKKFVYTRHHLYSKKDDSFLYKFFMIILRKYDHIVCVSYSVFKLFQDKGFPNEKLTIIHNGIPDVFFDDHVNEKIERKSIVSTGRLVDAKGFDILIQSISILKKRYQIKIHCYIIGEGEEKKALQDLAGALNVHTQIIFLGKKSQSKLISEIKDKQIYVCSSRFEGFNIALLEAMALNRPVISTKTGIAKDILNHQENGLLVEINNSETLAAAILLLFEDLDLANRIAIQGRILVSENFRIINTVNKLQKIYLHDE